MKTPLSLLACLVFAAIGSMGQGRGQNPSQSQVPPPVLTTKQAEPHTWKRYTVKGEHFSVTLPTLPAMTTTEPFVQRLQKNRTERAIGVYADGAVYMIHIYENPNPRQSLEEFIAEQHSSSNANRSSEQTVAINGYEGRKYSWRNNYLVGAELFFAVDDRLYKFSMGGAAGDDAGSKQFFSSIVLGKKANGIEASDGPGLPFAYPAGDKVYVGTDVDQRVRLAMKPEPSYTERARKEQITGTVVIKAVFSASGSVTNIRVVSGLPHGLTEKAVDAARKIKFYPAIKDGKYVSMGLQLEYNFNLY